MSTNFDTVLARLRELNRPPDPESAKPPVGAEGLADEQREERIQSSTTSLVVKSETPALEYIRNGWALVPIPKGAKGPRGDGWNTRERCVTTEADAARIVGNMGLAHAYSSTCVIDIDGMDGARKWLADRGVSLDYFYNAPDAVRISSGRPNRGKLLYRLPAGVAPLPQKKVANGDLDFRCGTATGKTVQDVLPPSIHPDTGKPYVWEYGDDLIGDWRCPPELPAELLGVWRSLVERTESTGPTRAPARDLERIRVLLQQLPETTPATIGHDDWLNIMFAIHHESEGSEEGLDLFDTWSSAGGEKYKGRGHVETRWRSAGSNKDTVVTVAWLDAYVSRNSVACPEEFDDLSYMQPMVAAKPPRRTIKLRAGGQPAALTAIGETLSAAARYLELMVYGGAINKAYMVPRKGFRGEPVKSLELNRVTSAALAAYLNDVADFVRVKKAKGDSTQIGKQDCPPPLVQVFMEQPERWQEAQLPFVERIAETPILVGNRVYSEPGYCAEAGAWINAPRDVKLQEPLTRAEALAALGRVREWLCEFPFESPIDEAVALSALLTAAMRASLPCAPGFVIDKPDYGAGASTLCKLVHIVLTGRKPAVLSVDRGEEELSKAIDSAQMAGASALVLDNVPSGERLRSIALTQVLSEPMRKPRVLGASRIMTVNCTQLVLVTGVNVGVADDLVRRFMRCRIDPRCDRPQERTFSRPGLLEDAEDHRSVILSDLYTIIVAYQEAGSPVATNPLAGFEGWAATCAAPLVWLGVPDPVTSSSALQSEDPSRNDLAVVMEAWVAAYGDEMVTVAELLKDHLDEKRAECRTLLERAAGCERIVDASRAVGKYLAKKKGAMVDGRRIVHMGTKQNFARWAVR